MQTQEFKINLNFQTQFYYIFVITAVISIVTLINVLLSAEYSTKGFFFNKSN